jgi:hypothetical protein
VADKDTLTSTVDPEDRTRNRLAISMVIVAVVGVTAISFVVVLAAEDAGRASRLVFTAVLPLFGTWVGTVLAYEFARENLKTATESTVAARQGHSAAFSAARARLTGSAPNRAPVGRWRGSVGPATLGLLRAFSKRSASISDDGRRGDGRAASR